jgi:thiol-disulfide isomerase/thioredoxin
MNIASVFLIAALLGTGQPQMLFFTSDHCPACQPVKPGVQHLIEKGYPIQEINISQAPATADRYRITQVPTFVLIRDGQELTRFSGQLSPQEIASMINKAAAEGQTPSSDNASAAEPRSEALPQNVRERSAIQPPARRSQLVSTVATESSLSVEDRAHQATVRFRVIDADGTNHGTGTIIHVHEGEALVLTCGHIFRESNGKGKIEADIGFPATPRTVSGKLLNYDAGDHDIALVVIELDQAIAPVPVAHPEANPEIGTKLFSFGCNLGDDPTLRRGNLLRISSYSGINKYDVSNRPIDGRSGGGLFAASGELIGVCNAADVHADEGIYAGLDTIFWQLREAGLDDVISSPVVQPQPSELHDTFASDQQTSDLSQPETDLVAVPPRMHPNPVDAMEAPAATRLNPVSHTRSDVEMIVIVRSKSDPNKTSSIVLPDPNPELLQLIASEKLRMASESDPQSAEPLSRLPARVARQDEGHRAQSPR